MDSVSANERLIISGCYIINIDGSPASIQSRGHAKDAYKKRIKAEICECENIFSDEVSIIITWHTDYNNRFRTGKSLDVDNIIKPTIDALVGRDGLIFDDCQVQSVCCNWVDTHYGADDSIEIRVETLTSNGDSVINKNGVCFFQLEKGVYYLFECGNMKKSQLKMKYDNYLKVIDKIEKLEKSGMSSEDASNHWFISATRFHHSRIVNSGFPCFKKDKILDFIETLPD